MSDHTSGQKLIVLSGLPGSGKSTLAAALSQKLSAPVFSVDPIEATMWRSGISNSQTGIAAYDIAATLAREHLALGHCVIIDAVNPIEAPRARWRNLAASHQTILTIIECICANEAVHRQRIEERVRNIEGMPDVTWARVQERRAEYEPWSDDRLVLDTSANTPDRILAEALDYLNRGQEPLIGHAR
jgi:predicted kinase